MRNATIWDFELRILDLEKAHQWAQSKIQNPKSKICAVIFALAAAALVQGCASRPANAPAPSSAQTTLSAGFAALDSQQYNEAIAKADEFLAASHHGPGSAEALYLKGRAIEAKPAANMEEAKKNLQDARAAYIQALSLMPRQPLDSYIRTSLANVAYFQDDYPVAISQWTLAYDKLDRDDIKGWALYRVGVAQQRLGQFDRADQTFASVQQFHPNTVPALRARDRTGARAFYVQLGTFATPALANQHAGELRKQGVATATAGDNQGHTVLRIGPLASYTQAQYLKTRFAQKYPDAVVVP
jgi:tetratricopeptide (TPR) repeat protein